jgi:hypothetical protein
MSVQGSLRILNLLATSCRLARVLYLSTQEQERVSVSVFVDPPDRDRLFELARRNERSASAELRLAIREHLERDPQEDEA